MPSLEMDGTVIPGLSAVDNLLDELLQHAETVKQTASIEPPLSQSDFSDLPARLNKALAPTGLPKDPPEKDDPVKSRRFAIIETVARDKFSNLIATTSIDSPDFVRIWNLFDILSILSDSGNCDPALLFWLVEEILDSQTIAGCRKVFDYLESRREKITLKNFEQKKLAILRTCNELLRRLSRAEDTAFCGRVFIFMFQSFPLGDKSSVNLRGEYHVENETSYDQDLKKDDSAEQMDVDTPSNGARATPDTKASSKDGKAASQSTRQLTADELYPVFWSLQAVFSQPKKLFDTAKLAEFKTGLEATMATFSTIKPEPRKQEKDKQGDESKRSPKEEKPEDGDDELANTFNPKYLTSRDLFELEISDISLRRSVLVQALIALDFLLSLSPKAKEKLSKFTVTNKSVAYTDQILGEEDTKWANEMKKTIGDYIRQMHPIEGPYFLRMVESVLVRDKNWIRWKLEGCQAIEMPAVSPQEFKEAKAVARKMATNRRPSSQMGTLSLDFLREDAEDGDVMAKFRSKERCQPPDLMSYKRRIADDDFEIEMPTNNQTKAAAIDAKASKSWRALRLAGRYNLASFDKIDNPDKIDAVFEEPTEEPEEMEQDDVEAAAPPEDRRPVVLVGPSGVGKSSLVKMLIERNPSVFEKIPAHVTRKAEAGETTGKDYHFVDAQAFSMMRDGDQFLQFTDTDGVNYATSRKLVDAVSETGKVPLLVMDHEGAQQVKDFEYAARFVFIKPSSAEILEARLKEKGTASEKIEEILKGLPAQLKIVDDCDILYERFITGDNLEEAYASLRDLIYGSATNGDQAPVNVAEDEDEDVAMADASGDASSGVNGTNGTNGTEA
ncbi:THO complex subunit 1 transcription elongation factor-domain-containing protein [Coniochaeta sp. 2T2.1]|nr:THO complex subunit 1 transcription elongation factor-domain-containing protein [Coniochaeta sp. 2T2.1]